MRFLALLLCLYIALQGDKSEAQISEAFDVKPGGESHKFEQVLGTFKCTFLYKAQGGTNEQWQMTIEKDDDGMYACSVGRPTGVSYLFFIQFKMKISGARIKEVEPIGAHDHPLESEEYVFSKRHNEVHSKKDVFKSVLQRLTVYAAESHKEL